MRNNLLMLKNGVSTLFKAIRQAVPAPGHLKGALFNKFRELRDDVELMRYKSRNFLETNIDLGLCHFYRGNVSEAQFRFWLIGLFYSGLPVVHYSLGRCYLILGKVKKAINSLSRALLLNPGYDEASYYLKKIQNPESILYIPSNIVKQYFDYNAENFVESWLVNRMYQGHEYVYILISRCYDDLASNVSILDLGCGTGICGHFLKMKGVGASITGVDLSNKMLNIARGCFVNGAQAYSELFNMEMCQFLRDNQNRRYDVVLLTEVLHYLGDITEILSLTKGILKDNGIIVGLVRRGDKHDITFIENGDFFCYSLNYVQSVAESLGLELAYHSYCKIYGNQVDGLLFIMQ